MTRTRHKYGTLNEVSMLPRIPLHRSQDLELTAFVLNRLGGSIAQCLSMKAAQPYV